MQGTTPKIPQVAPVEPPPGRFSRFRKRFTGWVESWSPREEFYVVVFIAFGLSWALNARSVAFQVAGVDGRPVRFTDGALLIMFALEAIYVALIYGIGSIRGWSREVFAIRVSWKGTGSAVLLYFATVLSCKILLSVILSLEPFRDAPLPNFARTGLSWPALLLNIATNPIFEECLETAYVVRAFKERGMGCAVLASALIRGSIHLYQGPVGAVMVLALGLFFAFHYWRWGQIWTLILVHAAIDFFALMRLM